MDDFDERDAWAALHACVLLGYAVSACASGKPAPTTQAAMDGVQALLSDYPLHDSLAGEGPPRTPANDRRVWRRAAVQAEVGQQRALLEQIGAMATFDAAGVARLRAGLGAAVFKAKKPRPRKPAGPARLTNQQAFDFYRRSMEEAIARDLPRSPFLAPADALAMEAGMLWMQRYMSRFKCVEGTLYAPLADERGREALLARAWGRDAAVTDLPDWARRENVLSLALHNNHRMGICDVGALAAPHGYGPSVRALWAEAKRAGATDAQAWEHVRAWAKHRPGAWDRPDLQKRKYLVPAALADRLAQKVDWLRTEDLDHPWSAEVAGSRWQVRLNDFPDDLMYSLVIDGRPVGDFHDWPPAWRRP